MMFSVFRGSHVGPGGEKDGSDDEARLETESHGVRLLSDCRTVFEEGDHDKMFTSDLIVGLNKLEESPWADWSGAGITARQMANLLKNYDVRPKQIRIDDSNRKGYDREDFTTAWDRYTPLYGPANETSETSQ
jgi:hypothetical protein